MFKAACINPCVKEKLNKIFVKTCPNVQVSKVKQDSTGEGHNELYNEVRSPSLA